MLAHYNRTNRVHNIICVLIILLWQKYSIASSIIFLLQYYNEAKGVCIHFVCVYCGSNILTIEKNCYIL